MKKYTLYALISLFTCCLMLSSCEDYLDIKPKGKKVPETIADYRAFLEYMMLLTASSTDTRMQVTNEVWTNPSSINSNSLTKINYLWMTGEDRISLVDKDQTYDYNYQGIYYCNLIINDVPALKKSSPAEEKEASELIAQAKVKRALHYFHLINTYAKAYDESTAGTDGGVPIITTADNFESVIPQKTVADVYQLMLDDLTSALPNLPETSQSVLLPNKASGYALLARVQLFMRDFDSALDNAEEALKRQSFIFDLAAFHKDKVKPGKNIQGNQAALMSLGTIAIDAGIEENILLAYGNSSHATTGLYNTFIPLKDSIGAENYVRDSSRFERGDARFLCNYYRYTSKGYFVYSRMERAANTGGILTTEVYLMRAECYARMGELVKAMADVNAIRKKRIIDYSVPGLPANFRYSDLTASTVAEAMDYIRHERDVELMGSSMMFYDLRRFNSEPAYQRRLVKVDNDGIKRTLEPNSDLWIMPFPKSVTLYNNTVKQNTSI